MFSSAFLLPITAPTTQLQSDFVSSELANEKMNEKSQQYHKECNNLLVCVWFRENGRKTKNTLQMMSWNDLSGKSYFCTREKYHLRSIKTL